VSAAKVERIRQLIEANLHPLALEVVDEGHKHLGHGGEGKGHFLVRVTSAAFVGLSPIKRHRLVYAAVAAMMEDGIHALAIEAKAPGE
jgi:BolA protein